METHQEQATQLAEKLKETYEKHPAGFPVNILVWFGNLFSRVTAEANKNEGVFIDETFTDKN